MGTCCRKVEGSERRRLGSFVICSLPSYYFSDGGHTTEALYFKHSSLESGSVLSKEHSGQIKGVLL